MFIGNLDSMDEVKVPDHTMLKAHKPLPRKRIFLDDRNLAILSTNRLRLRTLEQNIQGEMSEPKQSWILDAPKPIVDPILHLPPTPPSQLKERAEGRVNTTFDPKKDDYILTHQLMASGLSTPVNQRSPPTPDITPPGRQMRAIKAETSPKFTVSSARTDSFRTAQEHLSSEDESLERSSHHQSSHQPPTHHEKNRGPFEIDLGLGLSFQGGPERPAVHAPKSLHELTEPHHDREFSIFDGAWADEIDEGMKTPRNKNDVKLLEVAYEFNRRNPRKRRGMESLMLSRENDGDVAKIGKDDYFARRAENSPQNLQSPATDQATEQTDSSRSSDYDFRSDLRWTDSKRFSQNSAGSTVVEAMVVDTSPQRAHTLRHMGKKASLRTASTPVQGSGGRLATFRDTKHQLVHQKGKIADRSRSRSVASESGASFGSSTARDSQAASQPIAIPQRRSSLKATASAANKKPNLPLRHSSSRPATAPSETLGYFDIIPRRLQPSSGSVTSTTVSTTRGKELSRDSPQIPVRTSSLSAPTSRNPSRTASLTTGVLQPHLAAPEVSVEPSSPAAEEPAESSQAADKAPESSEAKETSEDPQTAEWSPLRPHSMLVTPLSQASMQSSTPGVLEVNEATAVNIYPHKNDSVVVVHQLSRHPSRQPEQTTPLTEESPMTLTSTAVTEVYNPQSPNGSPLQNPREAPPRPTVRITPPTISDHIISENSRQRHTYRHTPSSSGNPLSSLRRAFSARSYSARNVSESPPTLLVRSLSLPRRKPVPTVDHHSTVNAANPESTRKFSSLWRPHQYFWDSFSDNDSESDFGNDGLLIASHQDTPQKRVVSAPLTLSRRWGSLKLTGGLSRRPFAAAAEAGLHQPPRSDDAHDFENSWWDEDKDGDGINVLGSQSLPRSRFHAPFRGLAGLREAYEKRRENWEEKRRGKERARLLKMIKPVIRRDDGPTF